MNKKGNWGYVILVVVSISFIATLFILDVIKENREEKVESRCEDFCKEKDGFIKGFHTEYLTDKNKDLCSCYIANREGEVEVKQYILK